MNSTVSAGCPTVVTITPSSGRLEAGDELTCRANGYSPTYTWTGVAGVNGSIVSETGYLYTLAEGPFNVTCTAKVSQLPTPCQSSAIFSNNAYSKYEKQNNSSNKSLGISQTIIHNVMQSASMKEQKVNDFGVVVLQLILISIISNKAEFDGFHSRLMLLIIAMLASS